MVKKSKDLSYDCITLQMAMINSIMTNREKPVLLVYIYIYIYYNSLATSHIMRVLILLIC